MNKTFFFDSINEFLSYAMQESRAWNRSSRGQYDPYNNWAGVSWEDACMLALNGWREGLREVEKYRAQIIPMVSERVLRYAPVFSIAGYGVSIGHFLANDPECMLFRELEARNYPGRIFKIVCSIAVSAAIKPETIIQRGAMICALVDAIEYAGHRAEVICNSASCLYSYYEDRLGKHKERGWLEIAVTLKKADQSLDMDRLAFALAHPSMVRRIIFSAAEREGWSDFAHNYGYPAEATDKGDLYIKETYSGVVSNEQTIGWVLCELKKLGIDLQD